MGIYTKLVPLFTVIVLVNAQIPSFGGCPDYAAVKDFDREKFLGTWYEIERYFTVSEVGAKCVSATYEKRPDGKIYINNAFTNRYTGVQRIITGTMNKPVDEKQKNEGLFDIRYQSVPVAYDTVLKVLDTDYEEYAIIWSCSGVGPIGHTESLWVMARERIPAGTTLQKIYGVLDKFKISRTFFVESDQKDCETLPPAQEAVDPTEPPVKKSKPIKHQIVIENNEAAKSVDTPIDTPILVETPTKPVEPTVIETKVVETPVLKKLDVETPTIIEEPIKIEEVVKIETPVETPILKTVIAEKIETETPALRTLEIIEKPATVKESIAIITEIVEAPVLKAIAAELPIVETSGPKIMTIEEKVTIDETQKLKTTEVKETLTEIVETPSNTKKIVETVDIVEKEVLTPSVKSETPEILEPITIKETTTVVETPKLKAEIVETPKIVEIETKTTEILETVAAVETPKVKTTIIEIPLVEEKIVTIVETSAAVETEKLKAVEIPAIVEIETKTNEIVETVETPKLKATIIETPIVETKTTTIVETIETPTIVEPTLKATIVETPIFETKTTTVVETVETPLLKATIVETPITETKTIVETPKIVETPTIVEPQLKVTLAETPAVIVEKEATIVTPVEAIKETSADSVAIVGAIKSGIARETLAGATTIVEPTKQKTEKVRQIPVHVISS